MAAIASEVPAKLDGGAILPRTRTPHLSIGAALDQFQGSLRCVVNINVAAKLTLCRTQGLAGARAPRR